MGKQNLLCIHLSLKGTPVTLWLCIMCMCGVCRCCNWVGVHGSVRLLMGVSVVVTVCGMDVWGGDGGVALSGVPLLAGARG